MKKYCLAISITLLFTNLSNLQAQFDPKASAVYILDIAKYVTWQNEESIKTFKIGILSPETSVYKALFDEANIRKSVHDKPVEIVHFKSLEQVTQTQILFVNKKDHPKIDPVMQKVKGENTLLISEGYEFHESMINFVIVDKKNRFELNEKVMTEEGLKTTPLFRALAIRTKADWEKLFVKTKIELDEEKKVVASQKIEIKKQGEKINRQKNEIKNQQKKIESQKTKLANLFSEIQNKQNILDAKTKELVEQEQKIEKQEENIKLQQKELETQTATLDNQKKEIKTQTDRITKQKAVLNEQLEKIQTQRLILYLFLALIILISGMGYFIYRGYKIKKEANRKLEEKNIAIMERNEQITKQKEEIEKEKAKSDKLLLNILPVRVANDLKVFGATKPEVFDDVTVYFSDVVGFTSMSANFEPAFLINELNDIFTAFDNIVEKYDCERIKTIGDAYLAVCGMPAENPKNAEQMLNSSIDIIKYLEKRNKESKVQWRVRIGLHTGKVVGGIVGIKKYIYDVFGDTINTASRMESNSEPMRINISEVTYEILTKKLPVKRNDIKFIKRSPLEVKGKGKMNMYFVDLID